MSVPDPSKTTNIKNESANNINHQQENTNTAIDMDSVKKETVTAGPLTIAKSKEILCIDMESGMETQVCIRNQVEAGPLVNLSELTAHVISQRTAGKKLSIKGLYQYMVGYGKQNHAPRPIWDQGQTPLQPEQAVWMQYGPTQIQIPPQSPFGGPNQAPNPVKPTGPQLTQVQYPQGQGYPQQGQGYFQGQGYPPQGQGYSPQAHGYPPQGQGYGPTQTPAYYQGGAPQGQGSDPPQGGNPLSGYFRPTHTAGQVLQYDPRSRNGFVRLVMSIVLIMLLITAAITVFVLMTPSLKHFFRTVRLEIMIVSLILYMTANYGLVCSPCGRVCPGNLICLILAVIAMTLTVCKVTCHFRTHIVLYAVLATAAVVLVCIALACTSFDFTSYALYIIGISTAFSVIVLIIYLASLATGVMLKPLMIVILLVGTLIQVVVLTMELQMVLGGGKAIEISEQDYAIGAFFIYSSIVDIFVQMVYLLGILDS